jgi:hypothetical protein
MKFTALKIRFMYQFLHSCICEKFVYSQDRPAYLAAAKWEQTDLFHEVSSLVIHNSEHFIYIGFSLALHLQCSVEKIRYILPTEGYPKPSPHLSTPPPPHTHTHKHLKSNSWTYDFLQVSGHNLESSQTWGFHIQCFHYKPVSNHFCSSWGGGE